MSYTPTVWVTGDTVTPEKLNKIEQGIYDAGGSSSVFFVNAYYLSGTWFMQETAGDIIDALSNGIPVMVQERDAYSHAITGACSNVFSIKILQGENRYEFLCDNMLVYYASSLEQCPYTQGGGE